MIVQKRKGFRKLKKTHMLTAFFIMIFISVVVAVFLVLFARFFFRYFVESRIINEKRSISYMARIYDEAGDDKTYAFDLMDRGGRAYFIEDQKGNSVHGYGKNTCADEGNEISLVSYPESVMMYEDTDAPYIIPHAGGLITVDIEGLITWAVKNGSMDKVAYKNATLDVPLWLSEGLSDGNMLFAQMFFSMDMSDIIYLIVFLGAAAVLIMIATIMLLCYMISGTVRQRRMTKIFFMDDVTGSRNWMWFLFKGENMLSRPANSKTPFAVIDLVFVKYRNFCVCHSIEEGENLLRSVDALVNANIGRKEMCAHYASANFALLLRYTDEAQLRARLEDLLAKLENMAPGHKFTFHMGVDMMGIATENGRPVRRRDVEIEKEYNNACAARATLEESTDSGIAFFNDALVEEQRWISVVQEKQYSALQNEEFLVYYQPKYNPQTGKLSGAEALIRWNSPEYGFKGPGAFIPIFEKNGFITEIDHYMIRHVARDQKNWLDKGYACVPVSVNVSRAHFIESDLAEQIRDAVDAEGTPRNLIEIELTESAFFDDKNALISTISRLKEYGFTVSMDDFGSGYSSLNSLKDMPLDVLKLDAEFFRGEADDDRRKIVVSEAIRLAKSLNMRTVAEGVEIEEQVSFLAEQGCDMIQGFYYAKPMPGNEYEQKIGESV